jgi:RNA-binding protein
MSHDESSTADRLETFAAVNLAALEVQAESLGRGGAVAAASPQLTGRGRRHLRGLAHALKPLVYVGHGGATPSLAGAIDDALADHELIKVKLQETAPIDAKALALWIHATTGAQIAQIIGRTVVAWRPDPEAPRIRIPRSESL